MAGNAGLVLVPAALLSLIARHLRFDAADPGWPDRDRLVADPVMAGMARAVGEMTASGPAFLVAPGGPPGLAFGAALGLALAERALAARFGRSLADHRVWLLAAAEELFCGGGMEAASLAGAMELSRLTVLAELQDGDLGALPRYAAKGWTVRRVEDPAALAAALSAVMRARKPTLVVFSPGLRAPADGAMLARAGVRGAGTRRGWLKRLARHGSRDAFKASLAGQLPAGWVAQLREPGEAPSQEAGEVPVSTAEVGRAALARLVAGMPEIVGLAPEDAPGIAGGRCVIWGGQTLAQAGALLGMALHDGVLPVSLVRWAARDLAAPALLAAARAHRRVVVVIVVPYGEPAEGALAALRAMPGLTVYRPADAAETLACAALALHQGDRPSVILLSAQPVRRLPEGVRPDCGRGAYLVAEPAARDLTLLASGPELELAMDLRAALAAQDVQAAVVSMPCWSHFAGLDAEQQAAVLGTAPRVALEAGSQLGWERWLGEAGIFLGLDRPAADPAATARIVRGLLRRLARSPAILETSDNVLEKPAGLN